MSQTQFVEYRGEGFWAYDVAVGVFLKHLIDQATVYIERQPCEWLRDCREEWRVIAVISDYGFHLDPAWTDGQRQILMTLIESACRELEKSALIPAEVAATWHIHDGRGVFFRGAAQIATAPVVLLGRAVGQLLEGELPVAPTGSWWLYGVEDGISTVARRCD